MVVACGDPCISTLFSAFFTGDLAYVVSPSGLVVLMSPRPALCSLQRRLSLIAIAAAAPLCGAAVDASPAGVPAVYATKAEAEEAARKHFHCTGAHPMGQQWMPCQKHGQASSSSANH